jgi:hypothetical protein
MIAPMICKEANTGKTERKIISSLEARWFYKSNYIYFETI